MPKHIVLFSLHFFLQEIYSYILKHLLHDVVSVEYLIFVKSMWLFPLGIRGLGARINVRPDRVLKAIADFAAVSSLYCLLIYRVWHFISFSFLDFFRAQRMNDSRENKEKCEWRKRMTIRAAFCHP